MIRLAIIPLLFAAMTAHAGDILRGGAPMGAAPGGSSFGVNPANVSTARANARDALARTTQAVQSVKTMQAAAAKRPNNLGLDPNHPGQTLPKVPNGLGVGGLQVAPGVPVDLAHPAAGENAGLWQGAKLPVQTAANGGTKVVVEQTREQALLNWQTFNIGKETTLSFDQRAGGADAGKWIAFNKINDPSGVPSQILGSIKAQGQVYVINQNGIIFGGASQINLHSLVASSLPINENLIARGLLNNPDLQFLFSQLSIPTISGGSMPAFNPPAPANDSSGNAIHGDVTVQPGAMISAPTSADHVGGRVALIGPNVDNEGTISTPDGQTILAAGLQVGLAAHPSTDPSLRGLDVTIGDVGASGGTATNKGLIDAPRANVTIAGKSVNQLGAINSTTSVSLNGSVNLLADYNTTRTIIVGQPKLFSYASGVVTLGQGSVTQILPEWGSAETVIGTRLALASQIRMEGEAVHLATDSEVFAPNANVTLNAGKWLPAPAGGTTLVFSEGQIYLNSGAAINVAGSSDISAPISENIVTAQLRGAEFADAPVQRFGPFRGASIQVDIRQQGIYNGLAWVGTPLANVSGYAGLIQRSVSELTTAGGTVKLNAGGSVVMQPGSTIDVSGGWINYQGGVVETTRVVSDGRIYEISQATPDRLYDGIYDGRFTTTHLKWGLSDTYVHPLLAGGHYENGYTYGADAGSVGITAPSMALDGELLGATVAGPRQRTLGPKPGGLSLAFRAQNASTSDHLLYSPLPPAIVFDSISNLKPADPFALDASENPLPLRADRAAKVILSPVLINQDGFGLVSIDNGDGAITVPRNVALQGPAVSYLDENAATLHASLAFKGANLNLDGSITFPDGSLSFSAFSISPYSPLFLATGAQTPPYDPSRGNFTLGSSASLSAAGLVVDDRIGSSDRTTLPLLANGGSISINSSDANLMAGSSVDVSGGVIVGANGKASYGTAGQITIKAGQDLGIGSVLGGNLRLGAKLNGYSGSSGGSLTLQAPLIQVGGATANAKTLLLEPDFFSEGGFTSFSLNGVGVAPVLNGPYMPEVLVAPNTIITPAAQSSNLALDNGNLTLTPFLKPQGLRIPVSLTLNAPGVKDYFAGTIVIRGDVVVGEGSEIRTDPGANVTLKGQTVAVAGSIIAPGGSITVAGAGSYPSDNPLLDALPTVFLAPSSLLSAVGTTVLTPDPRGYRAGFVLPGGTIHVSGNIVAAKGATLDVSGASGLLDLAPGYSGFGDNGSLAGSFRVPTEVDSNGGTIILGGAQELFTDATLVGAAGGPAALGGSLSISSGAFHRQDAYFTTADINLVVTQNGPTIPLPTQSVIGQLVKDKNGNTLPEIGHVAVNSFKNGGFNSLDLGGNVRFEGPVTIDTIERLSVGNGGIISADSAVNLTASYVVLGQPFLTPFQPGEAPFLFKQTSALGSLIPYYPNPTYGSGKLTVTARLIDIGNLSLQGIGSADFVAANGDIRGDGTLDVAGDITMRAGQIYPATAVSFTIAAYDHGGTPGSITFAASGHRQTPLSAGAQLNVYGSIINQGGVLRAPLGTINLGWDGEGATPVDSITGAGVNDASGNPVTTLSIAPTQQLTLMAGSVTSVSAIDLIIGEAAVIPYGINFNGTSWIDPTGLDITTSGAPAKVINISGQKVAEQNGALIDIRGGGDLYAYRFNPGLGGSTDVLGSKTSFAIIPDYQPAYAPFAPFNSSSANFGSDPGYVNTSLSAGDRIYLNASSGLPAGSYTLLPARYALLPGAFLVTPKSGIPVATTLQPDGSSIVSGYRFNALSATQTAQPLQARFEVASAAVVRQRAEYEDSRASAFFASATNLPSDSGRLVLAATQAMSIQGALTSLPGPGGRGGLVDISSPAGILIAGPKTVTTGFNGLVIDSSELSSFGAASLLVGGIREINGDEATVTVTANNLTVDNAGASLRGQDIILAANQGLTIAAGAEVEQAGGAGSDETLLLGNSLIPGSGDGVLLRVNGNVSSQIVRAGVDSSSVPVMNIGAGAVIAGANVTLDSTHATFLDPGATLKGTAITLNSGQISIRLDNPGSLPATTGLVLSGDALQSLQKSVKALSLLSYSSIDLFGSGAVGLLDVNGQPTLASLALHAGQLRGFGNGGDFAFNAQNILLDNSPNAMGQGIAVSPNGTLTLNAATIRLGANLVGIDQFSDVTLNAADGILGQSSGGLAAQGNLVLSTPLLTAGAAANQNISTTGALTIQVPAIAGKTTVTGGLGASLLLTGASIADNGNIALPSGVLRLEARTGDLLIGNLTGSRIDASGVARSFFDVVKYTDGGQVAFTADAGNVKVSAGSTITVSAQADGGSAGSFSVAAPLGTFVSDGDLLGSGGVGGINGSFSLDAGSLASVASLAATLDAGSFTESRSYRIRTGDVAIDAYVRAHSYSLSADNGSIAIAGTIDASGFTGGTIDLKAHDSLTLLPGSLLTVVGDYYDNAGKGGAITMEAGSETNGSVIVATQNPDGTFSGGGFVDIRTGSEIDLGINHQLTTSNFSLGKTTSNRIDLFTGTLHLRAPQTAGSADLQLNPINGEITGASSIAIEGYKLYTSTGSIDNLKASVFSDGQNFAGSAGQTTAGYAAMQNRLYSSNPGRAVLAPVTVIEAGAEIINPAGDLTLSSDWNLASYRFGPNNAPGNLTLRASGNLVFNGALSDGFSGGSSLWLSPLISYNPLLPANSQSWSYRLAAGSDFSAVDFHRVMSGASGSLLLGKNGGQAFPSQFGSNALTSNAVADLFQVIRTGAGDIDVSVGRDLQLLNQFATIYTAGTQVANATTLFSANDFVLPITTKIPAPAQGQDLGTTQQNYPVQYSAAGGNIKIAAQNDITHLTRDGSGNLIPDSERQMPNNWLYRRGYVDPSGQFGTAGTNGAPIIAVNDPAASTTWWVDFSNFFEGVGALGGGNVIMRAGHDIANVDAVVPTNARMPKGTPEASKMIELGGGDLLVRAGHNIDGGVYYVERGHGRLDAGNSVTTNRTRSPSLGILKSFATPEYYASQTWLPTTLFLGQSDFKVTAQSDLLLGPAANTFLLPQGLNNKFWYKTYFSTYASNSEIDATSLGGTLTFRESAVLPDAPAKPLLQIWLEKELLLATGQSSAAYYQPWLRLAETSVTPFATMLTVMPSIINATAFSGDINIVGNLTLSPSADGAINLFAASAINGLQPAGVSHLIVAGQDTTVWLSSRINLSDANPASIPSVTLPVAFAKGTSLANQTQNDFLSSINTLFNESGSFTGDYGVLQTKQALHSPGLLHANDSDPIHLYAQSSDISGLTLFSGAPARIIAGRDITDISFYMQNNNSRDLSVVSAGRDIVAYDQNSRLRELSQAIGNAIEAQRTVLAGDIQINGPGTLEVLAGRDLDLGTGANNADGTGAGITSIGNARNPYLPFNGANIIASAGMGNAATALDASNLDFKTFISQFITDTVNGSRYLSEVEALSGVNGSLTPESFSKLPKEEQDIVALDIFYLALRDAGRDHNDPASPDFGTYAAGFNAIATLFPSSQRKGDITTNARDIRTKSGGNISLFAPGGQLTLQTTAIGNSQAPPGIITEDGGGISIFTDGNVNVGISRIFTLRGGNIVIWSSAGNIAAGASAKTVQSAPPTRVLIDPQSGDVATDLAGLATGGGIGVLATVTGIAPGDVDLIAPAGTIDAGDAGIRVSGNLNLAAVQVLNASNIQAGGASIGVPTTVVAAPNVAGLTAASNTVGAASSAADQAAQQQAHNQSGQQEELPSIITVEVIGYGGEQGG